MKRNSLPQLIGNDMILHRFCSKEEYEKYMAGEKLVNNKDHGAERGYHVTTAVGFWFFVEDPEKAKHWLSGIVDLDYCLTFETSHANVFLCKGRYADWKEGVNPPGRILRTEFCCREYDNKTFKLIKASTEFRGYAPNATEVNEFINELKKGLTTIKN